MEFLIRDRLSWLRFLGFDLGAVTPDENTIRLFREKLTRAGALDALFAAFDRQLRDRGYLPMGGQIVDATLVAAPKQRNTAAEKDAIKAGKRAAEIWPNQPAKAAQKDTDARWTVKFAKARPLPGGRPGIDIAIPSFGYKSSIAICRRYGFIRSAKVTDGARFDGRMLRDVVTRDNTASDVWADTAYRSRDNEAWLTRMGRVSRIHRKKPKGKPMPARTARANAARSTVRARIEHVFARQKDQMGLFVRTIGIVRAEAKITLANLAYNIDRLIFHERRAATG
jgi:IS5 family transposase